MTRASVKCITVQLLMSKRKKLYDSSASITTYFKKKSGKQCTGPIDFFKYYESDIDMSGRALRPRPKVGVGGISAALRARRILV